MAKPKLIEDPDGMVFEYLNEDEAEFLYEEVFVRRSYLRHGLAIDDGAVVMDAGANIGLFSLQCLREAKAVQVYAFEPIPVIFKVLVRNLSNSVDSVTTGTCPKPVALRLALGAEQSEEEFVFYDDNPGESTRHPEEREEQQRVLLADKEASSWRQTFKVSPCASQQTPNTPIEGGDVSIPHKLHTDNENQSLNRSDNYDRTVVAAKAASATEGDGNPPVLSGVPDSRALLRKALASAGTMSMGGGVVGASGTPTDEGVGADNQISNVEPLPVPAERKDGSHRTHTEGETFPCKVVPLSLALDQLGLESVELLKVDVEGDELAVLRGIDDKDWPKIGQVGPHPKENTFFVGWGRTPPLWFNMTAARPDR